MPAISDPPTLDSAIGGDLVARIERLRVWRSGERRAPHKPLLLLFAIGRLMRGERSLDFEQVKEALGPLLREYAPPVQYVQPQLPYWHLRGDGLWEIEGADAFPMQASGEIPKMGGLRRSRAGLPTVVADALLADPALRRRVISTLLEQHFPPSLHAGLRAATGLDGEAGVAPDTVMAVEVPYRLKRRLRDPAFRRDVLMAYEHRCAVTGFRAALDGGYFGVEAAHVHWHSQGGPDTVDNGLVLDPTMHLLFDRGAWSLTEQRRVVVSARFTGSDEAVQRLRGLHGRLLRSPVRGAPVAVAHIRWHRDPRQGGVFREPAL